MQKHLLIPAIFTGLLITNAQAQVTFQKTFGGTGNDFAHSVQQTADGGFIIGGETDSFGAGSEDVYLVKTASDGTLQWAKTFGGTGIDNVSSVQQTADGGFIMGGGTASFGAGWDDVYLVKTASDGTLQWAKTFGGTGNDFAYSVQQTADGGFIIGGRTNSFGAGSEDVYLVKTASDGTMQWAKTFGGISGDYAYSVQQTADGGFIMGGNTRSFGAGSTDVYLVKTAFDGTLQWAKTFGGASIDYAVSVQQTADGGFIIGGSTNSFGAESQDFYLVKTASDGTLQWAKTFGGVDRDFPVSVQQTADGGFIMGGGTASFGAGWDDVYLVKTASDGTLQWAKTFGGTGNDFAYSVQQTADGGFIIGGRTNSFGAGSEDVYLVKTASDGTMQWAKTFGGISGDYAYSVQQTADGGFIMGGNTRSFGAGSTDVYLVKTAFDGTLQWAKTFGGASIDYAVSVQQTADGGFIIGGSTNSFGAESQDFYLVKTASDGTLQWAKTFGGVDRDFPVSVQQTADGGFIMGGNTFSFGAGSQDVYLVKTASDGTLQWGKTFGGAGKDYAPSVQQTADGGFIIGGETNSFGAGDFDLYLIKTDNAGKSGCNESNAASLTAAPVYAVTTPATQISSGGVAGNPFTQTGSGGIETTFCTN